MAAIWSRLRSPSTGLAPWSSKASIPARLLVMKRRGREQVDLQAPLGVAADLSVAHTIYGKPAFCRHRKGGQPMESAPPIRTNRGLRRFRDT
jgi:hypothetical protein